MPGCNALAYRIALAYENRKKTDFFSEKLQFLNFKVKIYDITAL